jgi:hypothetical protein
MVVQDATAATIRLILASNNADEIRQLKRDLAASRYKYHFVQVKQRDGLVEAVAGHLCNEAQRLPTVLVINYVFATKACVALLELARHALEAGPIECVVTDAPTDSAVRKRLNDLGARLYNSDTERAGAELVLH